MRYDSTQDTILHIKRVQHFLGLMVRNLEMRALAHDASKLTPVEKDLFDDFTPMLKEVEYGTEDYYDLLKAIAPSLNHHYKVNDHHPQHYENGVNGMDLMALVEMFSDWTASSERTKDGSIIKSIHGNKDRFGLSDQLVSIFLNTVKSIERLDALPIPSNIVRHDQPFEVLSDPIFVQNDNETKRREAKRIGLIDNDFS